MSTLSLVLFGRFHASYAGHPLPAFRTSKAQALLIYMAAEPRPHTRESVMALLWPEMPQESARHNLRQVLYYLRQTLAAAQSQYDGGQLHLPLILSDRQKMGLNPDADVQTDIHRLKTILRRAQLHAHSDLLHCPSCRRDLEEAAALYQGDFLADFFLSDSGMFEEWVSARRATYQRSYLDALEKLGRIYLAYEEYAAAEEVARKQIAIDDLREVAQRQLLQALARTGRRNQAFAHYDLLRQRLWDELGVAPEAATVALLEQIHSESLLASPAPSARDSVGAPEIRAREAESLPQFMIAERAPAEPDATFVTRERELSHLQAAVDATRGGRGQVIFVIGGAGSGKSMLMQEFSRRAGASDPELLAVTCYCAAITGVGDPYLPFREALNMLTGDVEAKWAAGLMTRQQARQLWEMMPLSIPALVNYAPDLINSLLSGRAVQERAARLAGPQNPWIAELAALAANKRSSGVDQNQLFAEYGAFLKALAAVRPLLLIIEDLHWIDAASNALLFYLSREIVESRILLVGTYRPEEVAVGRTSGAARGQAESHPLAGIISELKRLYGDIWLDLSDAQRTEGRRFVESYLDSQPNALGEAFRQKLFQRTGGHPLFTVELVRAMQERGDLRQEDNGLWVEGRNIDWVALPLKVEGAIERRIEMLEEKLQNLLLAASVEGEIFTAEVLARVQQVDQRWLVQTLGQELDKRHQLVTAHAMELLGPGRRRISRYRFHHQLFQQYLVNRLDEVQRAYLHEAVAFALEQLHEGQTQEVAGRLAYHFEMAGLISRAIQYSREAGEAAADVHAYNEAVGHYTHALELAKAGGAGQEELAQLYTRLGGLLLVTRGDWAPEVGEAYGQAYVLGQQVGETAQLFAALRGLSMYYRMRGELVLARPYTEELMFLAQRLEDPILIVEASFALGSLLYFAGEQVLTEKYLQAGIDSYRPEDHRPLVYDQDPGVALLSYSSHNLWLLGYPDRALRHANQAVALAESLDHPYSLAMALIWSCWTHIFRGEGDDVLHRSTQAIGLSVKHDFPVFEALGTIQNGWAVAQDGQVDAGLAKMRRGLAESVVAMGSLEPPATLAIHFAAVFRDYQRPENTLDFLESALGYGGENGLRLLEPELYRLKGELLLARGSLAAGAEALFWKALDLARRQQVKSLELRAAMSLARLWHSQGKTEEARRTLAEVYNWFTEGFGTRDLQEAKALLQQLS